MAGYSGTPLPQKLGIRANHRIAILRAPVGFEEILGPLPSGVVLKRKAFGKDLFNVILIFVKSRSELLKWFAGCVDHLDPSGGLWVSWPKKASGVPTDVTEDRVREVALAAGLVDIKVCAIDNTWSGLKCVIRLKNRPKKISFDSKANRGYTRAPEALDASNPDCYRNVGGFGGFDRVPADLPEMQQRR
jgi:hypothetical protein